MDDIPYLPLAGGEFLRLATVLECLSRRVVVGWSLAGHMRTRLVADSPQTAAPRPVAGCRYRRHLVDRGARVSVLRTYVPESRT
ncbi:hypothetical protein ABZZ79_19580 [Streptomyces sp. NPDC006458]|uniref:hypothetical protein n=1 Tax=Streptomyces sp. NPDC006458 TaxID=3154302 RepID=UPI00339FD12F